MKAKILTSTAFAALCAAASMPASADCFTTIDLRPAKEFGQNDVVRLTNQGPANADARIAVVYPSNAVMGDFTANLDGGESAGLTTNAIFKEATGVGYSVQAYPWPNRFIRVTDETGTTSTNWQGTITNSKTGFVTPLIFTCDGN